MADINNSSSKLQIRNYSLLSTGSGGDASKKNRSKYKGTPAAKAIFLDTSVPLIYQDDERLIEPIQKYGCRFLSMLAIPQIVNNKGITIDGIHEIYNQCTNRGRSSNGDFIMLKDCTCGALEHEIMTMGFTMLGDNDRYCRQIFVSDNAAQYRSKSMFPTDKNVLFFIMDYNTSSDVRTYGGHHFMLHNALGDLIFDPGHGTVDSSMRSVNRFLCYKVYSRSRQDSL